MAEVRIPLGPPWPGLVSRPEAGVDAGATESVNVRREDGNLEGLPGPSHPVVTADSVHGLTIEPTPTGMARLYAVGQAMNGGPVGGLNWRLVTHDNLAFSLPTDPETTPTDVLFTRAGDWIVFIERPR